MFNKFVVDNSKIKKNISLRKYTSMHVGGRAKYFIVVRNVDDLKNALRFAKKDTTPIFILGGGSNIIVSDEGFDGLVIKVEIKGRKKMLDNRLEVKFRVGAGESWDGFVSFAVRNKLYGLENLSYIPGTVGASVIQNIGAYGAEVSDCVDEVEVLDIKSLTLKRIKSKNCKFSYRRSIFNDPAESKGKYVVLSVTFKLKKEGKLNLKYSDLRHLGARLPSGVTLSDVRKEIIKARDRKFPYPNKPKNGTVGSFWNAEVVSEKVFKNILMKLRSLGFENKAEEMKNKKNVFKVAQGYKIPYGVLIEVLGFKGKINKGVKILETHAGVINNFSGKGTAREVLGLSKEVIDKVHKVFGVKLRIEPELVGDFGRSTNF